MNKNHSGDSQAFVKGELYKMTGEGLRKEITNSVQVVIGEFRGANGCSIWFSLRYPKEVPLRKGYTLRVPESRFSISRDGIEALGENFKIEPLTKAERDIIALSS